MAGIIAYPVVSPEMGDLLLGTEIKEDGHLTKNFTTQDVLNKFGDNPVCYLTGTPIDLNKPETYHFDHVIPASKGGTNDLSNLEICLKEANNAKNDLNLSELYSLCESILNHRDKKSLD